ncbi:hypothetical protein KIL84_006944 [Mauremys mutica]|uniref:Ig-like domain-containing protein n=1 Tax=Mauremys mutica TaxID=74926 RepID=A0A9D3X1V2_9SAUR|nr:hypothetical protein KIL84_006944 [Mauremys mutica]
MNSQKVAVKSWTFPVQTNLQQISTQDENLLCTLGFFMYRRTNMFNRKYWCRGGSRSSCDVLGDTENFVKSEYKERLSLLDNRRGYFLVTMHQLVEEDSGMYWCGIQRPYADIMTAVKLTVTEGQLFGSISEPLSTPLITLTNHPSESCLGRSVTVRCHSATGSNVYYTWYRKSFPTNIVLVHSSDLVLRCGDLLESQSYFCQAATRRANKSTQVLRAEVLTPAKENCTYQLQLTGNVFISVLASWND